MLHRVPKVSTIEGFHCSLKACRRDPLYKSTKTRAVIPYRTCNVQTHTVEPLYMYYGHLGDLVKCPVERGVLILEVNVYQERDIAKCP